jgi:cyclopropane fatty-acyl-phospholipid synthase-like methyltransferase
MFQHLALLHPDAVTLHIGCGIGRVEHHLCKRVRFCYGIDISPSMIRRARVIADDVNVKFICNSGVDLGEIKDGSLDLVYSIFVFQHMPRDIVDSYFRDSFTKLADSGRFAFQMMVDDSGSQPEPPVAHPYGLRYYTRAAVCRMLDSAGFGEVRIYSFESWEPDAGTEAGDLLFVARKGCERVTPDVMRDRSSRRLRA